MYIEFNILGSQGIPDNLHEERRLKYARSQKQIPSPPESPNTANTIPPPPKQSFNHQIPSNLQKASEYQPNKIIPPPPQKFTPNNLIKPDPSIFQKIQKRHDQDLDKKSWRHFENSENVIEENTDESCVSLEEKRYMKYQSKNYYVKKF